MEHVIYASVATGRLGQLEMTRLLEEAGAANQLAGLTGILLHDDADGSFFQVLEGEAAAIERLMNKIRADERHSQVTVIIREPIAERDFADWTMGFASVSAEQLREIPGLNDFFREGSCFRELDAGRAKKLLAAFAGGRWRLKALRRRVDGKADGKPNVSAGPPEPFHPKYAIAFQPIVDTQARAVFSYEALIRSADDEGAPEIFRKVAADGLLAFDQKVLTCAIDQAARLGIDCNLHFNLRPGNCDSSSESILPALEAAKRCNVPAKRIVIAVVEGEVIQNPCRYRALFNEYHALGLKVAIDNFGPGYSGLNLLAELQPDQVKLDMKLIAGIERRGLRQAIVRAIIDMCFDLGIDVIVEGIETEEEYAWLDSQGIYLFQGSFFAKPEFETLPAVHYPMV